MKDIITNLKWRYAVKKFDSKKMLSSDKIAKLKEGFNLTATSYGLQPIRLLIVKNKDLQNQLVKYSFEQKQVAQASHVLVICIENNIDANYISNYFKQVKDIRGTSDTILDPFKKDMVNRFSEKEVDEIRDWSKNQAYLALGNLLSVCAMEEIDSCPMEGFLPKAYDELLELDQKGLTSVLVLPVGYRAQDDVFSDLKKVRRNLEDSIIEIF